MDLVEGWAIGRGSLCGLGRGPARGAYSGGPGGVRAGLGPPPGLGIAGQSFSQTGWKITPAAHVHYV